MSFEPPSHSSEADNVNLTDADLFLRLQTGKTDALATLYDRHAALVYSIALKLLKNTAEAEDLTQDIFLVLAQKSSFDPQRGSLRTYLAILTRSRSLDRLRSRARKQAKLQDGIEIENVRVLSDSPLAEVARIERSQEVQQALERLSIKEREVLNMAYYQGLSQSEIAQQLEIPLGTVKSRSRRSLIKLRLCLNNLREQS